MAVMTVNLKKLWGFRFYIDEQGKPVDQEDLDK